MTTEFADIVGRLAKARNFDDGSFLLVTSEPNADNVFIEMKGKNSEIVSGMGSALAHILTSVNNDEALAVRNFIATILITDEQKRYQSENKGGK